MYEKFYGLAERPFDLTPNPRFMYLSRRHLEALSVVHYGISGRKGITLLVGEAGTGKTTVVRSVIESLAKDGSRCVYLNNPALTRGEFYEFLAARFGMPRDTAGSKARFLLSFERLLVERNQNGERIALVIDEAQSLSFELLEEIRLLANLETATDKLLPVVMAGQPELADKLDNKDLRQLKQRVALRADLGPFVVEETAAYIAGRIRKAGGDPVTIFSREAILAVHKRSQGIPRTISVVCDNAMLSGFAGGERPIGQATVEEVAADFRLEEPGRGAAARRPASAKDEHPWDFEGLGETMERGSRPATSEVPR